jgi:hypothetical protein
MQRINADKIGMILSIGCMIHCVLFPILLPLLPMIGLFVGCDNNFHFILTFFIVGVAIIALIPGFIKHKILTPFILASIGITCLIFALNVKIEITETIVTILGGIFLIFGHYTNHMLLCKCRHHDE